MYPFQSIVPSITSFHLLKWLNSFSNRTFAEIFRKEIMERNQIIGIVLIMATFMLWTITSAPSDEELKKSKRTQDSLALVNQTLPEKKIESAFVNDTLAPVAGNDSIAMLANQKNSVNLEQQQLVQKRYYFRK
ncbi:MAG: hypothetical protein IPO48_17865 [Saprospiraceae bacterium]|nr:hypothetical protein [Saprospiraceae bacterium]